MVTKYTRYQLCDRCGSSYDQEQWGSKTEIPEEDEKKRPFYVAVEIDEMSISTYFNDLCPKCAPVVKTLVGRILLLTPKDKQEEAAEGKEGETAGTDSPVSESGNDAEKADGAENADAAPPAATKKGRRGSKEDVLY